MFPEQLVMACLLARD